MAVVDGVKVVGEGSSDAGERVERVLLLVGCLYSKGLMARVGWSKNEVLEMWSGWALARWWEVERVGGGHVDNASEVVVLFSLGFGGVDA